MKNIVLQIHKILGVAIAFVTIIISLTGSYLVWEREINPVIRQNLYQIQFVEKSNLLEKTVSLVKNNYPDSHLDKIILPFNINQPYRLILTSADHIRQEIYLDPYEEKILQTYQRNNTFDPISSKLHTELLSGNIGKIILGLSGISLFILTITGLYLWKGWQKLNLGFKIRWSAKTRILNYDLHQVMGIFSLVLVGNIAITGSVLALDKPLREILINSHPNPILKGSLVARFYDPQKGSITVDGHNLQDVTIKSWRSQIGIVSQETLLLYGTVAENIGYGKPGVNQEEIEQAAHLAHAHEFIVELPQGYDTLIGERGVKLSGGQRQRLAIARALVKNPNFLILDEATSSLDTESEYLIQQGLQELLKNRGCLVIAHRLSTIKQADIIVVLEKGKIIETGNHQELINHGGRYAYLSQMQFLTYPLGRLL
jgi:ABC-type polar amino acid transport system ATPase subunit